MTFNNRTIALLCVLAVVLLASCRKKETTTPVDPPVDYNSFPKLDSIYTRSMALPFAEYKFAYDAEGKISQMNFKCISAGVYRFYYGIDKRISKIISTNNTAGGPTDSILFQRPSGNNFIINLYTVQNNNVIGSYQYTISQSSTSIGITVTDVTTATIKARASVLLGNANANNATYSVLNTTGGLDTTRLSNQYLTAIPNPYYSIYQRLGIPLFSVLQYGALAKDGTGAPLKVMDMTQQLSKNCLEYSLVTTKTQATIANYTAANYVISNNNVTEINTFVYPRAAEGYINHPGNFFYR